MAQFDIYTNPSRNTRNLFPFVLDIQHDHLADIGTRIVIPLGKIGHFKNESMDKLTPIVEYQGEKLLVLTPQMASLPANLLKAPIGSLAHLRDEIIAALDFVFIGF